MRHGGYSLLLLVSLSMLGGTAHAGLSKQVVNVDLPGPTKLTGQDFTYRLTYSCNRTGGSCNGAEVIDLLPAEVEYVSTIPAGPSGDVAAINVTPDFGGSGRTRVQFDLVDPLTAGNSGDLLINVRFPNGSTPDGTLATNTADGINLETTPGTQTTAPVEVTAVASMNASLVKSLITAPAQIDQPETYRLRIANSSDPGTLQLDAITPVTDNFPAGAVFKGATPAASCEPGCIDTSPATLTWPAPCSTPLEPGQNCDILVDVFFPAAIFNDGDSVTNSFTTDVTPLGEPTVNLGIESINHDVEEFSAAPNAALGKYLAGGFSSSNAPTLNQLFRYDFRPRNTGNVDLDNMVVIDTLPVEMALDRVTTGSYNANLEDLAPGVGVEVSFEKNTAPGVFTLWGSSPDRSTSTTLNKDSLGLESGEYVTRVRWRYGVAHPGMDRTTNPRVFGTIVDPDNLGNPVAIGDTVTNCVNMSADYLAGPQTINRSSCPVFTLGGTFVRLYPQKDNLSGAGPYAPGQTVQWRLLVRSDYTSSAPIPLQDLVVADLLPLDLVYVPASWTFNPNGTGLPAPDQFEQIANYKATGRTLLRWTWSAGPEELAPSQNIRINYDTTVRDGAQLGLLTNTLSMLQNNPGLEQRCRRTNAIDLLDLDGDNITAENSCDHSRSIDIAPIAQLVSAKLVSGSCDSGGFTDASAGTLNGGAFPYQLLVQNVGTVAMESFTLVDILPFVGDTGVLDTLPRGSEWDPLLVSPIVGPPGVSVYYSTSGNPCRSEVGGPVSGCEVPNWSTVPPAPITDTKSFKLEFGSTVLTAFDTLAFDFVMTAPADLPQSGETAYNSFAWLAQRSDGLGSLGAEPNKVGVAYGACPASSLGDYVWIDGNSNGLQDDGPTGLNNVQMFLYQPGSDGVAGTFDDVQLSTTVTTDGPTGEPGWYLFPGLADGDYYVCAAPPPTYGVTMPDQGGDDAQDSDLNPATNCTQLVTLGIPEDNPDLDIGLTPPAPAALGNYVWFDRNSDGLQNESPYDGANGVTVRLFVDDADGIPEPGADDPQVAVKATTYDVNGIPGYYLFDGLAPGIPYFVQFDLPSVALGFTAEDTGGDDGIDSDADLANGTTPVVILAAGEYNPSLDAGMILDSGLLSLGNQVWLESDNDGLFEPENGELGVNDVSLSLYYDINGDGAPSIDEYVGATATYTANGLDGRYSFGGLVHTGQYIVVIDLVNFSGSGALAGLQSCTGNDPAPDPDDDVNGDDNGTNLGANIGSQAVTLNFNAEPVTDGDSDVNSNLTVDFCFTDAGVVNPAYDYGDAPDSLSGTGLLDYQTVALDLGAHHELPTGSPYLGDCVDADNGLNQNGTATRDDETSFGSIHGSCATAGDDEDGIQFSATALLPGDPLDIDATAAATGTDCSLNAWIDWNRDGDFSGPGEQIASDLAVASGLTEALPPVFVPAGQAPGPVYGRFRCSSQTGISPVGYAPDGEVEDYQLTILGIDLGDLPDAYGTLLASNGARHEIDPAAPLMLGSCVDTEDDGQPSASAESDDFNAGTSTVGLCLDDEDGVSFVNGNELFACQNNSIEVVASGSGLLDAWIDFDNDGSFQPGEQVVTSANLVTGNNSLNLVVPCGTLATPVYARFRYSSAGGLSPTGAASDGEVEDYLVTLRESDWGDAPVGYPVDAASNGALHGISPLSPVYLGNCVDTEPDGQPSTGADGDDTGPGGSALGECAGPDDEDGVVFDAALVRCFDTSLTVSASAAGVLDAWLDFNGDGDWADAGERVFNGQVLGAGGNSLLFNVPCGAMAGQTQARFRFSSVGVAAETGPSSDGEVEDYQVLIQALDLGDLSDSYGTLLASDGARHLLNPMSALYLGSCVDGEADGQPTAADDGDDLAAGAPVAGSCTGSDDEDGVSFAVPVLAGQNTTVTVTSSGAGLLDAWADFNGNGDFNDAGEQILTGIAVAAGSNGLVVSVPPTAVVGDLHTRFRLTSAGGTTPTGAAADGEVEDHLVQLLQETDLELVKSVALLNDLDASGGFSPGDSVQFTLTVNNTGAFDATGVAVSDQVPGGYSGITNVSAPGIVGGSAINWSGLSISAGSSIQLTFDANLEATGDYLNTAEITAADQPDPDSIPGNDDGDQSEDDEASAEPPTVTAVADLELAKSLALTSDADGSGGYSPGDTVTFTLTLLNVGPNTATGVVVRDQLPTGYGLLSATASQGVYTAPDWDVGSLASGASASLDITASINAAGVYINTAEVTDSNEFDPDSDTGNDDGDQSEDDESAAAPPGITPVADLELSKIVALTSDADASGGYSPGDSVTFTLTLTNTGPSGATGVTVTDQLPSGYTLISSAASQGIYAAPVWTVGGLAAGASVTLNIEATVNAAGDYTNIAQVSGSDQFDPDSVPGNDDGDQSEDDEDLAVIVVGEIADLSLTKTFVLSNDANGNGTVSVGDSLTFTITLVNAGPNTATGVTVAEPIPSGYSLVSASASQGSFTMPLWNVGDLPNGASATLDVVVTVNENGEYTNTAQVNDSDQFDPDSGPDNDDGDQSEDDEDSATPVVDRDLLITAAGICENDSPWLDYQVTALGFTPQNGATIEWIDGGGAVREVLTSQPLDGRLLWYGAAVDSAGNPTAWTGWELVNGQWFMTDDFDLLRPEMTVTITVNPTQSITVSYPPATPTCMTDPPPSVPGEPRPVPTLSAWMLMLTAIFIALLAYMGLYRGLMPVNSKE